MRSYRNVFALERRIYRIEGIRLNPGGVPIRGVLYGLVLLALSLLLGTLPVCGWLLALAPWYVRDIVLPASAAAVLALVRVEGRTCHLAAYALLRYALSAHELRALRTSSGLGPGRRWSPPELLLLADGSDARLRRIRFMGPGSALVSVPHCCLDAGRAGRWRRQRLRVRPLSSERPLARARVLTLARGARLDFDPT